MLNSTQVPNKLLEALYVANSEFSPREAFILLYVCRKTIGWQKELAWLSLSYIAEDTGHARSNLSVILNSLLDKEALVMEEKDGKRMFSLNEARWGYQSDTKGVISPITEVLSDREPTKDIRIKEKNTVSLASLADKVKSSGDVKELFNTYRDWYLKGISDREPHFNWAVCTKLAKPLIAKFGLDHMKRLLRAFLENEDKFYRSQAWSLTCFLSANTINKLNQNL